jgi:hypothetical protein
MRLIKDRMFNVLHDKIYWIYTEWQPAYTEILQTRPEIVFMRELGNSFYDSLLPTYRNLVVLDDQMNREGDSKTLARLFTEGSHHRNLSIIYIVQNLFDKSKSHRTVSLNAQYMVLFKNPRDKSQIEVLARQMFPGNTRFLVGAFQDATREPFGYLLLDLRPETPEDFRVRANILPGEDPVAYVP